MQVLSEAIEAFLSVLRSSWSSVHRGLVEAAGWDDSVLHDWAQANWEMIVEASLSRERSLTLEVYGDGADCNEGSSRVWRPERLPTHAVACRSTREDCLVRDQLTGLDLEIPGAGLQLYGFVSISEAGWYEASQPFDHALLFREGVALVVSLTDVRFVLISSA